MKQSHKIVMAIGFMVDNSEETVKKHSEAAKLLSIIGMASLMSRSREKSSDEDTALANSIKRLTTHTDLYDMRQEFVGSIEKVANNCIVCASQFDIDDMYIISSCIKLIDMVGELMVMEQEKEFGDDIQINL